MSFALYSLTAEEQDAYHRRIRELIIHKHCSYQEAQYQAAIEIVVPELPAETLDKILGAVIAVSGYRTYADN